MWACKMKLVLYSDKSAESIAFRLFLSGHNLQFEEVDAQTEGRRRLIQRAQQALIPALEIKRSHRVGVIVGFDEERIKVELGL